MKTKWTAMKPLDYNFDPLLQTISSICDGKLLETFKQGLIWSELLFKIKSGCCMEETTVGQYWKQGDQLQS